MSSSRAPSRVRRRGPAELLILLVPTLLLLAPNGTASGLAPFGGTSSYSFQVMVSSGCAHGLSLVSFGWNATTGRGSAGADVSAKSCPNGLPAGGDTIYANWSSSWVISVPVSLIPNASTDRVNATWKFVWAASTSYAFQTLCNGTLAKNAAYGFLTCSASASVEMQTWDYLVDGTTGYYYAPNAIANPSLYNFSSIQRDIFCHPKCTRSHSSTGSGGFHRGSSAFTFSFTLSSPNASHDWSLISLSEFDAVARISTEYQNFTMVTGPVGTTHARIDYYSGNRGAYLTQIAVT